MARQHVDTLEDERPRHVGHATDNLRVHQVAQTYEAGRHTSGNGNVVEHAPHAQLRLAHIEQQGKHKAQRAAMACQSLVAGELPPSVGQEMDGQKHLYEPFAAGEEIVRLVEDAVAQACTDENSEETVDEQRVEQLVFYLLFLIQSSDHKVGQRQSDEPAQRVPAKGSEGQRRVPSYKEFIVHSSYLPLTESTH